jgi:toxin-antitoxin system PIN domain toxin
MEKVLAGNETVGIPWPVISAFLRISTNTRLPAPRMSMDTACEITSSLLDLPVVRTIEAREDHWRLVRQLLHDGQATGNLVTDAQIAALTIEWGGVLHTTDRDFARFPGLRWVNPLT